MHGQSGRIIPPHAERFAHQSAERHPDVPWDCGCPLRPETVREIIDRRMRDVADNDDRFLARLRAFFRRSR